MTATNPGSLYQSIIKSITIPNPTTPAITPFSSTSAPKVEPIVSVPASSIATGKAPKFRFCAKSRASSGVKPPEITAWPPVIRSLIIGVEIT